MHKASFISLALLVLSTNLYSAEKEKAIRLVVANNTYRTFRLEFIKGSDVTKEWIVTSDVPFVEEIRGLGIFDVMLLIDNNKKKLLASYLHKEMEGVRSFTIYENPESVYLKDDATNKRLISTESAAL